MSAQKGMTINGIVDYLTYCSYRANRGYSPDITPERWKLVYQNVDAMEAKYQEELKRKKITPATTLYQTLSKEEKELLDVTQSGNETLIWVKGEEKPRAMFGVHAELERIKETVHQIYCELTNGVTVER